MAKPRGTKNKQSTGLRASSRDTELSYIPSAWKMLAAQERVQPGVEFTSAEGIDGERVAEGSGITTDQSRRSRWRVVSVHTWHFTAEFISPKTRANGLRRSFTWADVLTGKIAFC